MSGRLNTRVSVAKTVSKSDSVYRSLTQFYGWRADAARSECAVEMAQRAPAKKYLRALCLGVWLSQPFWLAAS
ncbi:MAG TPA: hypothetical protein VMF89_11870, partial [Polyangiales bacterium]|nr:hypothetical protein [Polyangiales bacterium]